MELIFFSVLADTFWVLSKKHWVLLPTFTSKITVLSVSYDKYWAAFRIQFRCFVHIKMNLNQRYDNKVPRNRGVKFCKTGKKKFRYLQGTLTSNALFWNPVQCSPKVKLVNLVWILTYIFKDVPDDFDSYAKGLTKKSWFLLSRTG